jgi:hypothetical protein
MEDRDEERKKALLKQAQAAGSPNASPLSQASAHLGFPAGSAAQALLGGRSY